MFGYDHGWGGSGWLLMTLMMLTFWALLVWGVTTLARSGGPGRQPDRSDPERVLADRLARGEIDETEYRQRRAVLDSRHRGHPAARP